MIVICICMPMYTGAAALPSQPSGTPSVIDRWDAVETDVCVCPLVSVRMRVARVGEGVRVGIADMFRWREASSAEYVLVARPDLTVVPGVAVTESLNVYVGVLSAGGETRWFGSVVGTVAETEARKADTDSGVSVRFVAFESG